MKITVTQEDINNGKRADYQFCPIALALNRAFHTKSAEVNPSRAYVTRKKLWLFESPALYFLPPEASNFVTTFDQGKPVAPFEFELGENVYGK